MDHTCKCMEDSGAEGDLHCGDLTQRFQRKRILLCDPSPLAECRSSGVDPRTGTRNCNFEVVLETPRCFSCQSCGISAEESC